MPAKSTVSVASYFIKARAAVAVVAILSVWACIDFYEATHEYAAANTDRYGLGGMYRRLEPVLRILPHGVRVGYLSDVPVAGVRGGTAFFAARNILAPRLVMQMIGDRRPEWVLGNFSKPVDAEAIAREHGLVVARDLGQGLVVFRRQADR